MRTDINGFLKLVVGWSDSVVSLYKEINEVQTAFNHRLVDLDTQLKKELELATKTMKSTYDSISPSAKKCFDDEVSKSKVDLDKLIAELKAAIKKAQDKAGTLEKKNVVAHDDLQKQNPELNDKEEALKVDIQNLADECRILERQLAKYDGIRGWFAGSSVASLRKTFNDKMKKLESLNSQINFVRKTWSDRLTEESKTESTERTEWMTLQKDIATSSMELANIEKNYEALSFQNAITALSRNEIPNGFSPECEKSLKTIKALRTAKDELVDGLVQVSGMLATLKGINDGFAAFAKSIANLKSQQDTYSSLPKLQLEIPDSAITYNQGFTEVVPAIKDEKKMAEDPKAFAANTKKLVENNLADKNIEVMFTGLGNSIEAATKNWKG